MRSEQFWELIGVLGGVADEESAARLGEKLASLPPRTVESFGGALDERIGILTESLAIPEELRYSEYAEWFAAAIIAAGRPAYEKARRAREPFTSDGWAYEQAEDLLVVSENILEPVEIELEAVEVEWLSVRHPEDVEVADDPVADDFDPLESDWGVRVIEDPLIGAALTDVSHARTWQSWFRTQAKRPGVVRVAIDDEAAPGLSESGTPDAREYRYCVSADRLLDATDRRAEMRGVLVEAWTAVADSVGWKAPPPDPGPL